MAATAEIYRAVLGNDLSQCVQNAKVLVVGAGGIGCELLKNLVLTGFKDLEVVSEVDRNYVHPCHQTGKRVKYALILYVGLINDLFLRPYSNFTSVSCDYRLFASV